jgi:hypothetical protein
MLRFFAALAMFGGFLAVSPGLRASVAGLALEGQQYMAAHSPLSYVAAAAVAASIFFMMVRSALAPR